MKKTPRAHKSATKNIEKVSVESGPVSVTFPATTDHYRTTMSSGINYWLNVMGLENTLFDVTISKTRDIVLTCDHLVIQFTLDAYVGRGTVNSIVLNDKLILKPIDLLSAIPVSAPDSLKSSMTEAAANWRKTLAGL
jgi:hypothetical protein